MKSNNALPKPALLTALLLSVVVPVRADITIFTDEAMFLSAVSATGTDRFDDLPAPNWIPSSHVPRVHTGIGSVRDREKVVSFQ